MSSPAPAPLWVPAVTFVWPPAPPAESAADRLRAAVADGRIDVFAADPGCDVIALTGGEYAELLRVVGDAPAGPGPEVGAPAPPPAAAPTVVGSVVRRPLPDGRAYPLSLAARQFNAKHVALLDRRLESLVEGLLLLGGVPLTPQMRYELLTAAQAVLLPEVYDPEMYDSDYQRDDLADP